MYEADDMRQRRIVAQFKVLIEWNVVELADCGDHLRLLHGIDAEIGFQIQVQIEHVLGIAGLLGDNLQYLLLDRFIRDRFLGRGCGGSDGRGSRQDAGSWRRTKSRRPSQAASHVRSG